MSNVRSIRTIAPGLLAAAALGLIAAPPLTHAGSMNFSAHSYSSFLRKAASHNNKVWLGSQFGGVLEWDTTSNTGRLHTPLSNGLPSWIVNDIAVDPASGDVWVATDRGAAMRPANAAPNDPWTIFNSTSGNTGGVVTTDFMTGIGVGSSGVWVGHFNGAYRLDAGLWSEFGATQGFFLSPVTSIRVTPTGATWFGSGINGSGIAKFEGGVVTPLTQANTGTPADYCTVVYPPEQLGLLSTGDVIGITATNTVWCSNLHNFSNCDRALSRFDGAWATYTATNSVLSDFNFEGAASDNLGNTYLVRPTGVFRFDNAAFTNLGIPLDLDINAPNAADFPRSIAVVGADAWVGTEHGLYRYRDGDWRSLNVPGLSDGLVRDIAFNPSDPQQQAVVTSRFGLERFDGADWTLLIGPGAESPFRVSSAVDFSPDGLTMWVGQGDALNSGGLARVHEGATTLYTPTNTPALREAFIQELTVNRSTGEVWLGYFTSTGVTRFNPATDTWTTFIPGATPGLPNSPLRDVEIAPDGAVWVATNSSGLARFDGTSWQTFNTTSGLANNSIRDIAIDPSSGAIWVGTSRGVSRSTNNGANWTSWFTGSPSRNVTAVGITGDGNVWIGINDLGVALYNSDANTWQTFNQTINLINARFHSSKTAQNGDLWFGTENGIWVMEAEHPCPGDFDANGVVEVADIFAFLNAWFSEFNLCTMNCQADIDANNAVEVADIFVFLNQWFGQFGSPCP